MNKALLSVPVLAGGLMFAQPNPLKPAYDFSLPQADKIKLAESAAPREVSGEATVYVLEHTGYVKTREGSNGCSCFVDRQTPWNSEPTCFDAEGAKTTLPTRLFVEEMAMPMLSACLSFFTAMATVYAVQSGVQFL